MSDTIGTIRLLKEEEASKILNVKVSTLRRWRWSGDGPQFVKIGSAVRYQVEVLMNYIDANTRRSTSDPGEKAA